MPFLLWIAFAVVVGVLAAHLGRGALLWTLLAIVLSPLVAGVVLAILGRAEDDGRDDRFRAMAFRRRVDALARSGAGELDADDARRFRAAVDASEAR